VRIFISWSGGRGQHLATTLRDWLPMILPDAKPWTSTELRRGSNWTVELLDTLREARACLFCVTADGLESPWEYFEAGMLHGSSEDPLLTRCLCLDVPPQALAGGPLASIPPFRLQRTEMLAFLSAINALLPAPVAETEIEARYEQARGFFNARMSSLPEARARRISVVVPTPEGLCPIDVTTTNDTEWATFVASVRDGVAGLVSAPVADRNLERCLDLDADAWIEPPLVLAQLKAKRIAFGPPADAAEPRSDSAKVAAIQLHQILDVTPKQNRALAAMRRDLKDLVTGQKAFHNENARYASTGELDFYASPGTSIEARHTATGFHAIATRADVPAALAVRLGDGAGRFQEQPEGTEFMPDFQPSRFYVLKARSTASTDDGAAPEPL
jgi:hypothetical protein